MTMDITISNDGNIITTTLKGRLDTLQATECEAKLAPLHENADKELVLECGDLEYISSSGLRLFLSLLKDVRAKGGSLVLKNVNNEIRNIFAITGFQKLFNIQD